MPREREVSSEARRAKEEARRPRPRRDPPGRQRSPEPAALGEVMSGLMRDRVLAGGLRVGLLARTWPQVVGERLAAETAPVRLDGGILVVAAADGPWGAQARFLA